MRKLSLYKTTSRRSGIALWKIHYILNTIFDVIKKEVQAGNTVDMNGLGTFQIGPKRTGQFRNYVTGEPLTEYKPNKVKFTQSSRFYTSKPLEELPDENE